MGIIAKMARRKGDQYVSFRSDSLPMHRTPSEDEGHYEVNHLSSYETLVAGGDKTKEILLRRSKSNVDKILCDIVKNMLMQKLASLHFESIGTWMLYAPTMFVTLFSACISIFSTSELISNETFKAQLTISVAFLQLFLSVLQSLSKQLDYSAKAGFHRSAARTLQKIHGNAKRKEFESRYQTYFKALKHNKTRLSVGMNAFGYDVDTDSDSDSDDSSVDSAIHQADKKKNQKEDTDSACKGDSASKGSDDESDATEKKKGDKKKKPAQKKGKKQMRDTDSICKQFRQAMDQVDSFVPARIANAFNVLENRIRIINESLLTDKTQSLVAWEQVLPALFFQLSENIIESPGWPFRIPVPSYIVNETLSEFKDLLRVHDNDDNNADLLMRIMDRSSEIREVQARLEKKRRERKSLKNNDKDIKKNMEIATREVDHLSTDSADLRSRDSTIEVDFYPSKSHPLNETSPLL